jgi:hypothetical protein
VLTSLTVGFPALRRFRPFTEIDWQNYWQIPPSGHSGRNKCKSVVRS